MHYQASRNGGLATGEPATNGTGSGASAWPPLVYVIVLTWNGREHLQRCLPSLLKTQYRNFRVTVVDNASEDGSAECVSSHFPDVEVLRNSRNLGYAGGNNRGMRLAIERGAKYVVLLNDDTVICDKDWIATAVECAETDRDVGMVGFQPASQCEALESPEGSRFRSVSRVDGWALFIRCELLENLGMFDTTYFAYAEEDDLQLRAARAGHRFFQVAARIHHLGGGTSKRYPYRTAYLQMRNYVRFAIKNFGPVRTALRICRLIDIACNPYPLSFSDGNPAHERIRNRGNLLVNVGLVAAALGWNLLFLPQTLRAGMADSHRVQAARAQRRAASRLDYPERRITHV